MFALFFRPSCHLVALPDFALSQKGAEQTNCVLLPTDLTSVSSSNSNQQMSMFQKSPNYSFRREVGETALSIITVQMSLLQSILMTQKRSSTSALYGRAGGLWFLLACVWFLILMCPALWSCTHTHRTLYYMSHLPCRHDKALGALLKLF